MKSLSQIWYTPQEITTLRLWLAVAFVINLVLSSIEWTVSYTHLTLPTSDLV